MVILSRFAELCLRILHLLVTKNDESHRDYSIEMITLQGGSRGLCRREWLSRRPHRGYRDVRRPAPARVRRAHGGGGGCLWAATAPSWEGPYQQHGVDNGGLAGDPITHPENEDPAIFTDPRCVAKIHPRPAPAPGLDMLQTP